MDHIFIHSSLNGHLGCCHVLAIINSATMNTGVHRVLVAQLCLALCDPMDCSPPGSIVHGILQPRILRWVVISFSILFELWLAQSIRPLVRLLDHMVALFLVF